MVFVSIDDIKFSHGFTWREDENMTAEEWQKIFDESYKNTADALKVGKSVFYDSANQSRESRDELRKVAKDAGADAKVIFMNIPESVVRERWLKNHESKERFHLPERFFNAAFSNYEPPTADENVMPFNENDSVSTWASIYFNPLRVRVAGFVIKDNSILLMRRINRGKEYWVFPGGGKEKDEELKETVVREFMEETSIKIEPIKILYHVTSDVGGQNYFYDCKYISGDVKLGVDSEEYMEMKEGNEVYEPMWIAIDRLPKLLLYPLEIRDILIEDLKNGFSGETKEFFYKVADRRRK